MCSSPVTIDEAVSTVTFSYTDCGTEKKCVEFPPKELLDNDFGFIAASR